jgi:hypothetical protein
MIPKHKQIPNYYYVIYFLGVFNVLLLGISFICFDLVQFYSNLGINKSIFLLVVVGLYLLFRWSNNLITKNLIIEKLNLKNLRKSIIIKLFISIIVIFCFTMPFFEIKFQLSNIISDILKNKLPTVTNKTLEYVSTFFTGFINLLISSIFIICQSVIANIVYEFIIKPYIRKKKQSNNNI